MSDERESDRALLREAFALLLGLRTRPDARNRLGQAVTFLHMLEHEGLVGTLPVVVSLKVVRLRKH